MKPDTRKLIEADARLRRLRKKGGNRMGDTSLDPNLDALKDDPLRPHPECRNAGPIYVAAEAGERDSASSGDNAKRINVVAESVTGGSRKPEVWLGWIGSKALSRNYDEGEYPITIITEAPPPHPGEDATDEENREWRRALLRIKASVSKMKSQQWMKVTTRFAVTWDRKPRPGRKPDFYCVVQRERGVPTARVIKALHDRRSTFKVDRWVWGSGDKDGVSLRELLDKDKTLRALRKPLQARAFCRSAMEGRDDLSGLSIVPPRNLNKPPTVRRDNLKNANRRSS